MKTVPMKNGKPMLGWIILAAFLVLLVGWAFSNFFEPAVNKAVGLPSSTGALTEEQVIAQSDLTEKEIQSCDGIASVNYLYDDKDAFKIGTDPSTNITIFDPIATKVADDATGTSVPILRTLRGLAGNTDGVYEPDYFAKEIEVETVCSDINVQPELYAASAPTMTVVNDDLITKNSDSNSEAMDAESTYSPCVTIKAPSNAASSVYGAIVAFEYDATHVQKIESTDLKKKSQSIYIAHTTNQSASDLDFDQWDTYMYEGELISGQDDKFCFDVTTTASAAGENQANVQIHWLPVNKDLDADTFEVLTGIYDEDNNIISIGNTSVMYYTQ